MTGGDGALVSLERWCSALFVVSGAIGLVYATEAFMGTYPSVRRFPAPLTYVLAFVGLLGLYPVPADRSPKLARVGAVFAAAGILGWLVSTTQRVGPVSGDAAVSVSQLVLILARFFLGFWAFGAASLRTDGRSRTMGYLLLAPAAVMVLNLGVVAAGLASPEARLVNSGLWALSFPAIGFALRDSGPQSYGSDSTADTTAR